MDLSYKARVYLLAVVSSGFTVGALLVPRVEFTLVHTLTIFWFALLAFLAEIYEVEVLYNRYTSTSTAIYIAVVLLWGAPSAIMVAVIALLGSEAILRGDKLSESGVWAFVRPIIFNIGQVILAVTAAALAFRVSGAPSPPYYTASGYLPGLLALVAYTAVNEGLVSGILSLTGNADFVGQVKFYLKHLHIQILSMGILSILIAVLYSISPWNVVLIVVLMALVNVSLRNYMQLRNDAKQTFEKMTNLLGERDPYTASHSESVGDLSEEIAREMGLGTERINTIVSAARVHDIGKIGVPDEILLKPSELTEEEWEIMKQHPEIGADILSGLEIYQDAVDVVKYEHERWDGSGYPEGLEGEEIPLESRIIAAADIWDALTTERPYRGPLSEEEAKEVIRESRGEELDPEVAEALLEVVE